MCISLVKKDFRLLKLKIIENCQDTSESLHYVC